jgi:tetratricopeptide (TPR) repeat protein
MADRTGQRFGNYRLIRLIGRDGFGDVYLGKHMYLSTHAAIKILHTQLSEKDVENFIAEARIVAHLRHSHIVRVLEFGVQGEMPFLVMDYAPNGSLRRNHPEGMRLPLTTIVRYTMQIADALQYAHDRKLIHRDIKPENIFLGEQNEVLLGDFGIAVLSRTGLALPQTPLGAAGTPYYMAPEQFMGQPSRASDQYALGVVVYEWLCGSRPFEGGAMELIGQHLHASPPPLRQKVPLLPSAVERVVMKALAKDPKARYGSVREFAQALNVAVEHISRIEEGDAHYKARQYKEAIADYERALMLVPNHVEVYNKRGLAYYALKEYEKALGDCTRALELNPKSAYAYASRGEIYRMLGDYERAVEDCTRALGLNPKLACAYASRGQTYRMLGDYERAVEDCTRALDLNPKSTFAYICRGEAYRMLGDYERAVEDCTRALDLNPKSAFAYVCRGEAYTALKDYRRATHDFDSALELNPDNSWAKTRQKEVSLFLYFSQVSLQEKRSSGIKKVTLRSFEHKAVAQLLSLPSRSKKGQK